LLKRLGSYDSFREGFNVFKENIEEITQIPFYSNNFPSKKILSFTIKILESDILNEDEILKNKNQNYSFENIINNIISYIEKINNVKENWNRIFFWLQINLFIYYWSDTIYFFSTEKSNEINLKLQNIWFKIKETISDWSTNFNLEFILGISFLLKENKKKYLDYFRKLKNKFINTTHNALIEDIIDFISLDQHPFNIKNFSNNNLEINLGLVILILKFGNNLEIKSSIIFLKSLIDHFWEEIIYAKQKLIKGTYIRDWLSLKYLELLLLKKLETIYKIEVSELDYFSLSPREFERIIYWIFKAKPTWKHVQWRGAAGREKGKDLLAKKQSNNRFWIIQAKREKNFSRANLINEYQKVKQELKVYNSEGYILCIAKNASDDLRKAGEYLEEKSKYKIEIWDREDLNYIVKKYPILLKEFFNYEPN